MSVEKIVEKILEDARAEARRALEEAEREAAKIEAQSEAEAERVRASILKEAEEEAERRARQVLAEARLEAKQRVLAARRKALDRVFEEALRRLQQLPDEVYVELLKRLIVHAAETGREEIVLSPDDRAKLPAPFLKEVNEELHRRGKAGELTLSDEMRPLGGGVVLRSSRVEINASFPVLIERARERLEIDVARMLFGSPEGESRGGKAQ